MEEGIKRVDMQTENDDKMQMKRGRLNVEFIKQKWNMINRKDLSSPKVGSVRVSKNPHKMRIKSPTIFLSSHELSEVLFHLFPRSPTVTVRSVKE